MRRDFHNRFVVLILGIILIGFTVVSLLNYFNSNKIIKEDSRYITELTAVTIFAEIQKELTKPIFVALTMANDSFVQSWLRNEGSSDVDLIISYLNGIKNQYGYSSAFLVSGNSGKYYHTDGVLKTVSRDDDHDVWFYSFLDSGMEYDLDVDTDQANNEKVLVFFKREISYSGNSPKSVIGVGLEMSEIKEILLEYDRSLGLNVMLINPEGLVQVSTDDSAIEKLNYFSKLNNEEIKSNIISNKEEYNLFEANENHVDSYIFTKYIKDLDWYLVVENSTATVKKDLINQQFVSLLIIFLVVAFVTLLIGLLIKRYQKSIIYMATRDPLTGLMNRRAMNERLQEYYNSFLKDNKPISLFIFDIDNFKKINDSHGHSAGDEVLCRVAKLALSKFGDENVSRLGGDEFTGALFMGLDDAVNTMNGFRKDIENDELLSGYTFTVSVGIYRIT